MINYVYSFEDNNIFGPFYEILPHLIPTGVDFYYNNDIYVVKEIMLMKTALDCEYIDQFHFNELGIKEDEITIFVYCQWKSTINIDDLVSKVIQERRDNLITKLNN